MQLHDSGLLHSAVLLDITDPPNRFSEGCTRGTQVALDELRRVVPTASVDVRPCELLAREEDLFAAVDETVARTQPSVLVDLSGLPKRYMFPLLKRLHAAPHVRQLAACYTRPNKYGDLLFENPRPPDALPGFRKNPADAVATLAVALGFEAAGLAEIKTSLQPQEVRFFCPLPDTLAARIKLTDTLRHALERAELRPQLPDAYVSVLNPFAALDAVRRIDAPGTSGRVIVLAPYGPKPVSLGFALAAIERSWPVYYSQPTSYAADYSSGVRLDEKGSPETFVYGLRIDGVDTWRGSTASPAAV